MVYQLKYHLMCIVDGSIYYNNYYNSQRTEAIHANNDVVAIGDANEFLKAEKSGLIFPWAPMLYEGERLVAKSDPGYPPNAHYLSWVGDTIELKNSFQDLVDKVCQELQDDFILFVNSGEASEGYLIHLDCCPKCQESVKEAFDRMATALENLSHHLNARVAK